MTSDVGWTSSDYLPMAVILSLALLLRLVFFTGFFGADEVTYLQAAMDVLAGDWSRSGYIGSLRYGVNIPMAVSLGLFGVSEVSAGLWGLATSTAEVGLVYVAARRFWGARAAICAGLAIACLPIHVHYAGRLIADAPLSFFISLGFVLVYLAEQRNSIWLYLLAGMAIGAVYWIKDAVFFLALAVGGVYVLAMWRFHLKWIVFGFGAGLVVLANMVLMLKVQGDLWHLFQVSLHSGNRITPSERTSPFFYLYYLLLDPRHFSAVFVVALAGLAVAWSRHGLHGMRRLPNGFIAIWMLGFLLALSVLALRQPNYLHIIAAPTALLAGWYLSVLGVTARNLVMVALVCSGVVLSALQQQAVRSFTSNSIASVDFARSLPDARVYGGTGAFRADAYLQVLRPRLPGQSAILPLEDLDKHIAHLRQLPQEASAPAAETRPAFAIMDPQTFGWDDNEDSGWGVRKHSTCLTPAGELSAPVSGAGRYFVQAIGVVVDVLPPSLRSVVDARVMRKLQAQPAVLYRVAPSCLAARP